MTRTENWAKVGHAVRARRLALGYDTQQMAAAAAKVSPTTWGGIESGRRSDFKPFLLAKVARLLRWTEDSFLDIARGKEPTETASAPTSPVAAASGIRLPSDLSPDEMIRLQARIDQAVSELRDRRP